jgi:hypothetical protein
MQADPPMSVCLSTSNDKGKAARPLHHALCGPVLQIRVSALLCPCQPATHPCTWAHYESSQGGPAIP